MNFGVKPHWSDSILQAGGSDHGKVLNPGNAALRIILQYNKTLENTIKPL